MRREDRLCASEFVESTQTHTHSVSRGKSTRALLICSPGGEENINSNTIVYFSNKLLSHCRRPEVDGPLMYIRVVFFF